MQTFLPYRSFHQSAACLDRLRLGKQRLECKQIYNALTGVSSGWRTHVVTRMWEGYEEALVHYGAAICQEWIFRGYRDTLYPFFLEKMSNPETLVKPHWLTPELCDKYKSLLLRKNPGHYRQYWPDHDDTTPMEYPR